MQLLFAEARKHRAFREAWIGYIIAGIYLLLILSSSYEDFAYPLYDFQQRWFSVQQNIRIFEANLTAFLIAIGLPRLICCEADYRTDVLIQTSERGAFDTWRSKVIYTILYCAAVVFIPGTITLLVSCSAFGFEGALLPVTSCVYFIDGALPPMSNLAYCALQYVFLFLSALYFAGFVLLIAVLTRKTALTLFISGGVYLSFMVYTYILIGRLNVFDYVFEFLYRFSFSGFLLQDSFSWARFGFIGIWSDVWKPITFVFFMIALEFSCLWLLWRRRSKK